MSDPDELVATRSGRWRAGGSVIDAKVVDALVRGRNARRR